MKNIMKQLNATTQVVNKNLDQLLLRGERLEILEEKSKNLQNFSSKLLNKVVFAVTSSQPP